MKGKIDVDKDLDALKDFLKEAQSDAKELLDMIKIMKTMRRKKETKDILEKEILHWDKVLEYFEFYEEDVDVNGERVKNIAKVLKKLAKTKKINKDILSHIKEHDRWNFDW